MRSSQQNLKQACSSACKTTKKASPTQKPFSSVIKLEKNSIAHQHIELLCVLAFVLEEKFILLRLCFAHFFKFLSDLVSVFFCSSILKFRDDARCCCEHKKNFKPQTALSIAYQPAHIWSRALNGAHIWLHSKVFHFAQQTN